MNVCACASGRTIGGTIFKLRVGAVEVVYAMDITLKRETILDGASIDLLPSNPSLLICEGHHNQQLSENKRKKEKGDCNSSHDLINKSLL